MGKGKLKNLKNGRMMYDDDPGCKYLVIENPWPLCRVISRRNGSWFEHVGAWLWYATDKTFLPDEILYIGTKNEVIVKFSDKLDVSRLLGRHDWSKICLKPAAEGSFSYIFEYNYGMKGHPDDHQWLSFALRDLTRDVALQNGALPIKQPYPPPEWADCKDRLRSCKDLALPMPIDKPKAPEQPKASATPQSPDDLAQTQRPPPASIFSGLAQHIPDRPQQATAASSAILSNDPSQPPPGRLYTGKLDPEYEEALAARLLKSEPRDEKVPVVKLEAGLVGQGPNNDPSPDVLAQYEAWRRSMGAQSADVKQEPDRMEGPTVKVEPGLVKAEANDNSSDEIRRLHAEYERQRSAGTGAGELSVKREDSLPHRIKPEPEGVSPLSRPGESNVKPEPLDVGIRKEPTTRVMDPRRRNLPPSSNGTTAVKRENDTHDQNYDVKRLKTE